MIKVLSLIFISCNYHYRKVFISNFNTVGQTIKAELYILKNEKLDACVRSLFANPVTYTITDAKFSFFSYIYSISVKSW